jgi:acyl-CoA synthetase (AMP-forming)/AMP-acid ligase II
MLDRIRAFFRKDLSTANLTERLLALHGEKLAVLLDTPLEYASIRGDRVGYGDLHSFVRRFSAVLAAAGVGRGDRVVLATENRFDLFLLCLAALRLGAVAVPLGAQSKADEIEWAVGRAEATTLVLDAAVFRRAYGAGPPPRGPRLLFAGKAADAPPFGISIDAALDLRHPIPPAAVVGTSDLAMILYTSGTTGRPKGAKLSSGALAGRALIATLYKPAAGSLVVVPLPLAHIMGIVAMLLPLVSGIPIRFHSEFREGDVLESIASHRATFFVGVPTMYRMMAEAGLDRFDLSSVRVWVSAADKMSPELMAEFKQRGALFDVGPFRSAAVFVDAYGSVELAGAAIVRISPPGTSRLDGSFLGILLPPFRARIVGEDGNEALPGETGELWIAGPGTTDGYVGDEVATLDLKVGRFVRTGDLAKRDLLGLIHFVDRKKDVVKSGGYSVFPAEIERVLAQHPDVDLAVAFGVPHPSKGEAPVAAVTLRPGATATTDALLAHARERLSDYKAPRRIFVLAASEIPYGPTRKVLRTELAARFHSTFGP